MQELNQINTLLFILNVVFGLFVAVSLWRIATKVRRTEKKLTQRTRAAGYRFVPSKPITNNHNGRRQD